MIRTHINDHILLYDYCNHVEQLNDADKCRSVQYRNVYSIMFRFTEIDASLGLLATWSWLSPAGGERVDLRLSLLKLKCLNLFQCNHNIVKQTVYMTKIFCFETMIMWNELFGMHSLMWEKSTQTSQEQKVETSTSDHSFKMHFNNQKCCWWLTGKKLMWDDLFLK